MENVNWYENIPVMLNNHGDPLTDNQVESTVHKVKSLVGYNNVVGICTKAVPSESAYRKLEQISNIKDVKLFIGYSLTGLNEGNYSFKEREEAIMRLYDMFGQMNIMFRPLIKGRNDSHENIERIVDIAAKTGNNIILGGLHNRKLLKQLKDDTKDYFIDCCNANGVRYFNKTSCVVAYQYNTTCKVHDVTDNKPKNLDIIDKLGYKYTLYNDHILLDWASSGDMNLVRFITESLPYTKKLTSRLNKISFNENHNYELTSGWLSWSNNEDCPIKCDYCVMSLIDYLADKTPVGCHPKDLKNITIQDAFNGDTVDIKPNGEYISYNDYRVQQDCIKYK